MTAPDPMASAPRTRPDGKFVHIDRFYDDDPDPGRNDGNDDQDQVEEKAPYVIDPASR
nr:hypothetical protein [Sphingomonas sp. H160509]